MKKDDFLDVLLPALCAFLIGLFIVTTAGHCRERIVIPQYVDDTLRISWKPADPSYYMLYQKNYSGSSDIPLKIISYKDSTLEYKIDVPYYNYRAAFYVKAFFMSNGNKTTERVISDTVATFFSQSTHLFGDVNLDSKVDTLDFNYVLLGDGTTYWFGVPRFNPDYNEKCDVNGDGDINLVDLSFIYRRIYKLEAREIYSKHDRVTNYERATY